MDNNTFPRNARVTNQPHLTNNNNARISTLAAIPTEIIEKIIEHLDVPSISNLRLTCRDMAKRSVGPHFKSSCFGHQTTDLSSARLDRVKEIVSHSVFGPALKHLTVWAIVYYVDPRDWNHTHEDADWLSDRRAEQTLSEWDEHEGVISHLTGILKQLGPPDAKTPTLESGLDLMGGVAPGPGKLYNPARSGPVIWKNVSCRASQAFYITVKAMVNSGLKTPLFWVFRQTRRCSVPAGTISWLMACVDRQELARSMSGIKNFALSFAPVIGSKADLGLQPVGGDRNNAGDVNGGWQARALMRELREEEREEEETVLEQQAMAAVPEFVRIVAADVEVLDLHMFNPYKQRSPQYSQIFVNLARDAHFPKLKECVLRGIWATEESLVQFLQKHGAQLRSLKLRDIWLTQGTWAPIFRLLHTDTLPNLEFLRLENLFYGNSNLINLAPQNGDLPRKGLDSNDRPMVYRIDLPSNSYFNCSGGKCVFYREWARELFWLESRDQMGVPVGLEFTDEDRGMLFPSPQFKNWKMTRGDEFGPPPEAREWEEHHVAMGRFTTMPNRA